MGEGGGHRRRRGSDPAPCGGRGRLYTARAAEYARRDALRRKAGHSAVARSSVARAPRHPRSSAPGHRLAGHGAARSPERVQVRSVRALPGADRPVARSRHRANVADRGQVPAARAAAAADAVSTSRSRHRRKRTAVRSPFRAGWRRSPGGDVRARGRRPLTRRTLRPGGEWDETNPVRAARARSSNIATVRSLDDRRPFLTIRPRAPQRSLALLKPSRLVESSKTRGGRRD